MKAFIFMMITLPGLVIKQARKMLLEDNTPESPMTKFLFYLLIGLVLFTMSLWLWGSR